MRTWNPDPNPSRADAVSAIVSGVLPALGERRFGHALLESLGGELPVGSLSVYRTGPRPAMFLSASVGFPDTTRDCWRAYLSGPIQRDRTLQGEARSAAPGGVRMCHITAAEVPAEHRAKVYEAHGVMERLSIVQEEEDDALFAVNFYRHRHQRALRDGQLADFARLGSVLLALTRKHIAIDARAVLPEDGVSARLLARCPKLTRRELDVCTRLLLGMTQDGVATDLGVSVPTVKTYRNRAFARLGIHFRSELFALMLAAPTADVAG